MNRTLNAIKDSKDHWRRIIDWMLTQNPKDCVDSELMFVGINESWGSAHCALCALLFSIDCYKCPLEKAGYGCRETDSLYLKIVNSSSWKEAIDYSYTFLGVLDMLYTQEKKKEKSKLTPKSWTYIDSHKASGLKVGDRVKVLRKCKSYKDGWGNTWESEMDSSIGNVYEIVVDKGTFGFRLPLDNDRYCFPYFVLEKIKTKKIVKPYKELIETLISEGYRPIEHTCDWVNQEDYPPRFLPSMFNFCEKEPDKHDHYLWKESWLKEVEV